MASGRSEAVEFNDNVSKYVDPLPSPQKEITISLRDLLHGSFPELSEEFKWNYPAYYYRGKRICSLGAFKNHVNLEFDYGSSLTDDKRRIEGVGKNIRHIKIRTLGELDTEYFIDLLRQSVKIVDDAATRPSRTQT
jgi:hypothetical protein